MTADWGRAWFRRKVRQLGLALARLTAASRQGEPSTRKEGETERSNPAP